ncbi:MAG TPA: cbb3-type cytochrome c oxidase subunit 3 [Ignavibacteriaceae bacterium]|nr:cbb3-type cytochrome c oxidase subunit 3 [Ignavibacteriaceae bacterium]
MFSKYIAAIEGVEIYAIIALIFFFIFFISTFAWAFTRKKDYLKEMENLPLDNNSQNN